MIGSKNDADTGNSIAPDNLPKGTWLVIFLGSSEDNAIRKWPCVSTGITLSSVGVLNELVKIAYEFVYNKFTSRCFLYDWSGENSTSSIDEGIKTSFGRGGRHRIHEHCDGHGRLPLRGAKCSNHVSHFQYVNQRVHNVAVVFDSSDFSSVDEFNEFVNYLNTIPEIRIGRSMRKLYPICSTPYPRIPTNPNELSCGSDSHSCIVNLICKIVGSTATTSVHNHLVECLGDNDFGLCVDDALCVN